MDRLILWHVGAMGRIMTELIAVELRISKGAVLRARTKLDQGLGWITRTGAEPHPIDRYSCRLVWGLTEAGKDKFRKEFPSHEPKY